MERAEESRRVAVEGAVTAVVRSQCWRDPACVGCCACLPCDSPRSPNIPCYCAACAPEGYEENVDEFGDVADVKPNVRELKQHSQSFVNVLRERNIRF